jgi:hypothetical protein
MAPKRDADGNSKAAPAGRRFTAMFEGFRDELDEHHDRRERIIKASRDITAASKKMYASISDDSLAHGRAPSEIPLFSFS